MLILTDIGKIKVITGEEMRFNPPNLRRFEVNFTWAPAVVDQLNELNSNYSDDVDRTLDALKAAGFNAKVTSK